MDAIEELIWRGSYGGTTIDQICEKAGVKKGSFYYFFDSKAELAVAALDAAFKAKRPIFDEMFSPSAPPLQRFKSYSEWVLKHQGELKCKCGTVLGCPLFTLGSEICNQEPKLCAKVQEMMDTHDRYIETAVRDAYAAGFFQTDDLPSKIRMLRAYIEGLLTQARIRNDMSVLKEMLSGIYQILGIKETQAKAA
ncbi:MAG TPA: TetR/AcrR family transcriptional regulator [Candidatus Binatia bacterium]|nr:TetR/AcrR family transcriptional regulator [Candidatus Binatia bacterium]